MMDKRFLCAVMAVTATSSLGLFAQPASAKDFFGVKLEIGSPLDASDFSETFLLDITTEDSSTTVGPVPGYPNPGVITPGGGSPDPGNPLLTSLPYTFSGYRITGITGKLFKGGVHAGNVKYNPDPTADGGSNAEVTGVFNYLTDIPTIPPTEGNPIDLIAHAKPDNLFNPGGEGLGFSLPSPTQFQDNYVSFGGFAFDVFNLDGTFDEPYQLFTVGASPTDGIYTSLKPGDYAGCPGSCVGAKINPVPGPLPLLGVGAAFGYSRKLRKRIKSSKPEVISTFV
jgi:hypothetical protein